MTAGWNPVSVLPNVPLLAAIECDIAALAPAHDPRVTALKRAQPMFRRFLGRFSDNFGEKFEPAVLLVRSESCQQRCQRLSWEVKLIVVRAMVGRPGRGRRG
jgi:hypothetical protein